MWKKLISRHTRNDKEVARKTRNKLVERRMESLNNNAAVGVKNVSPIWPKTNKKYNKQYALWKIKNKSQGQHQYEGFL